jgi:hypothetical protein
LVKPSPANDGSDVDAGFKWVSQAEYDALANVLAAAKALLEDGEAEQDDVNAAAEALDTAIDTFEAINKPNGTKPADKAALSAAITDAQAKLAAVVPSGNATADGNGSDVHTSQKWVPRSVYITFQNAINAAIAVKDVTTVQPQATVDTALATLAAATATFDAVTPQNGTSTTNKAELNAKIEEAETLLETTVVSTDGSNVLKTNYWVSSQTPKTTLDDAITAAETVADNAAATQAQVDAAKNTLTTAIANFTDTNVRKPGLATALNVTVSFTGLADETMTLTGGNSVNWDAALTVSLTESFTSYQWYLNGTAVSGATANSITLAAKSHRIGSNRLAVEVTTASGAIYSKTLNFTVSQVNAPAADGE